MQARKILWPVLGVAIVTLGWRGWGWPGVALAVGGIAMWLLLHFTRMMRVLQRASSQPVGWCESAVMLHARLQAGVNLLHLVALTRAFGEALGEEGQQPEAYRWTDASDSSVRCEFMNGRLVKWELFRPAAGEAGEMAAP